MLLHTKDTKAPHQSLDFQRSGSGEILLLQAIYYGVDSRAPAADFGGSLSDITKSPPQLARNPKRP
jgi:hypothetical protein